MHNRGEVLRIKVGAKLKWKIIVRPKFLGCASNTNRTLQGGHKFLNRAQENLIYQLNLMR